MKDSIPQYVGAGLDDRGRIQSTGSSGSMDTVGQGSCPPQSADLLLPSAVLIDRLALRFRTEKVSRAPRQELAASSRHWLGLPTRREALATEDSRRLRPRAAIVEPAQIHVTADVSADAVIGDSTVVWHHSQVREGARIGGRCVVGKGVYVDVGVVVGNCCKLQNSAFLFSGASIEDGVFLGPGAMLLNDRHPRAINTDGSLKSTADWEVRPVLVRYGASIGAGGMILPGVTVGRFAMVAAGAVVVRDVPDHGLVAGNPARLIGWACECGRRLACDGAIGFCVTCGSRIELGQESGEV